MGQHDAEKTSETRAQKQKRFTRYFIALDITSGVLLLTLLVLLGILYGRHIDGEYEAWQQKLREAGYPATTKEFIASYGPIPEEENAAPLYEKAFESLDIHVPNGDGYNNLKILGGVMTEGGVVIPSGFYMARLRAFCDEMVFVFSEAREAAERPRTRFNFDFSLGESSPSEHLAKLRLLAIFLSFDARVAAEDRDADRVLENECAILRMAHSVQEEPRVYSRLASIVIRMQAIENLPSVFEADAHSDDDLQILDEAFSDELGQSLLRRSLADWVASQRISNETAIEDSLRLFVAPLRVLTRREEIVSINDLEWLLFAPDMPWHELLDRAALAKARPRPFSMSRYVLGEIIVGNSDVSDICRNFATSAAFDRIARVAIAVERFRLANNHLPSDSSDFENFFPDGVPMDPFDGRPIRYRRDANGYTVYTAGRNRIDDGGRFEGDTTRRDGGLTVVHIPKAEDF